MWCCCCCFLNTFLANPGQNRDWWMYVLFSVLPWAFRKGIYWGTSSFFHFQLSHLLSWFMIMFNDYEIDSFPCICKYLQVFYLYYTYLFVIFRRNQSYTIYFLHISIYICKNTHTHTHIYIYILVLKYLYCVFPPLAWVKFHPFLVSCRIISLINLFASLVDTRFTRGLSHLELSYIATCWYLLTSCDP